MTLKNGFGNLFYQPMDEKIKTWSAYHLTEKSGWSVKSIMVSDLPI